MVGREAPSRPSADPVAAWIQARDAVQAALDDPETAATERDTMFGRMSFEQIVGQFGCFDLLVHTWDLARAAGLDERLDPEEVHRVFETAKPMDEMMRRPGVCGPKLEPPPGADEQTRLLAFLGRAV
ncbi:TIGR03086 family protein [Carbonactinospora thermoautotrophica]|uniref:TIGR03086 family protein n=1 Tax=Carbonactinospora thermoautotrophica TaxID=1469144 RepID=UPI0022707958|nr:TIGR03086 family protein [Carbonactinospora thermoautotrophica]